MKAKYGGWARFTDTSEPYQWWEVRETLEAYNAPPGWSILRTGPDHFQLRNPAHVIMARFDAGTFARLVGFDAPRWRVPPDLEIREQMDGLVAALKDIAQAIRDAGVVARVTAPSPKPTPASEKSNGMVRKIQRGSYSDGTPYTDWELLVDAPTVPASRDPKANPPHARKGDVLREEPGDELTPFQLRRNGVRIGDPEWWQVRHLFGGLRDGAGDADGEMVDRLLTKRPTGVALALAHIPRTLVRQGDLLVIGLDRSTLRGTTRAVQVPRGQFLAIADAFGTDKGLLRFVTPPAHLRPWDYLRHPSARRGLDRTSRTFVLRGVAPSPVRPVPAQSDEGAIFELLSEVGCRLGG